MLKRCLACMKFINLIIYSVFYTSYMTIYLISEFISLIFRWKRQRGLILPSFCIIDLVALFSETRSSISSLLPSALQMYLLPRLANLSLINGMPLISWTKSTGLHQSHITMLLISLFEPSAVFLYWSILFWR